MIIAHRGASYDVPENTIASFERAWEQGADAIEGDFHLAPDGRIICSHDFDPKRQSGEGLPDLPQVMRTVPAGKEIFIEIKCGPEILPALLRDMDASPLQAGQMRVIAFDPEVVSSMKQQRPAQRCLWLSHIRRNWRRHLVPDPATILSMLRKCDADGIGCQFHPAIDSALIGPILTAGYEFHVWTVDDPILARRLQAEGVRSITTNRPGLLKAAFSDSRNS